MPLLLLDINAPEFLLLLVLAIILFGPERLPELFRKVARVVQYVRTVAGTAQTQLSKELGPGFEDLDLRDLNPKSFIQKHLLDEVQPIVADVKSEIGDLSTTVSGASGDVTSAIHGVAGEEPEMPEPVRVLTPFDPDAT
jgi:sec-independent protein translocase protein TatB